METLIRAVNAVDAFLADEQSTIDAMLVFARRSLGQRPLGTTLEACGELDAPWQRLQAAEALRDALEDIARAVDEEYGEDWDPETRTHFDDLITRVRHAVDALVP